MSGTHAEAMAMLIQAELDGELDGEQAADLAKHVAACDECQALLEELRELQATLRSALPRYQAPPRLGEALAQRLRRKKTAMHPARRLRWLRERMVLPAISGFVAGAAVAAVVALAVLPEAPPETFRVAAQVATATERSLQPGHLLDTKSTIPAELAEWFRLHAGFAPPMRVPANYTLAGGRLDYLHHRTVTVLIYQRQGQTIELYTWPEEHAPTPPVTVRSAGFVLSYWRAEGIEFWAIGRSRETVGEFVHNWTKQS